MTAHLREENSDSKPLLPCSHAYLWRMLGKEITDIKPNGWTLLNRDSPVMKTVKEGKIPIKPALLEVIISLHIANYPTYKKPSHRSINNKLNQPKVSWTTILGILQEIWWCWIKAERKMQDWLQFWHQGKPSDLLHGTSEQCRKQGEQKK